MTSKRLTTLFLAAAVSMGSTFAMADSSTGTTNPAGSLEPSKGGQTGTGTGTLPNRNTDGSTSATPKPGTSSDLSTPQGSDTKPTNGKTGMGGTGSEGTGASGTK